LALGEALTDGVIRDGVATETPGGSPLNVAIGLGRLNHDVTLATRFGSDVRGEAIRSTLKIVQSPSFPKGTRLFGLRVPKPPSPLMVQHSTVLI